MFCSRTLNNRINRLHERALRIVYRDYTSTFSSLLENDNSVSIHVKSLQTLVTEIFKVKNNLSHNMKHVFRIVESRYNLQRNTFFDVHNIRTEHYGLDSLAFLGPNLWDPVFKYIKSSLSLIIFKDRIKTWQPNCPCRLCRTFKVLGLFNVFSFIYLFFNTFFK